MTGNLIVGIGGVILSSTVWGSCFIVCKGYNMPKDGIHFAFLMSIGILFIGLLTILLSSTKIDNDYEVVFSMNGIIGGTLWALGNFLTVPIIEAIGLGVGLAIWSGTNMIVAFVVGAIGLEGIGIHLPKESIQYPFIGMLGVLLALGALIIFANVKSEVDNITTNTSTLSTPVPHSPAQSDDSEASGEQQSLLNNDDQQQQQQQQQQSSEQSLTAARSHLLLTEHFEVSDSSPTFNSHHHRNIIGGIVEEIRNRHPHHVIEHNTINTSATTAAAADLEQQQQQPARRNHTITIQSTASSSSSVAAASNIAGNVPLGVSMGIIAGVLYGFNFVPLALWNNKVIHNNEIFHHPLPSDTIRALRFFFSQYAGIFITALIGFLIYCLFTNNKPQLVPPEATLPSIVCGAVWAVGCAGAMFATSELGNSVGFPLVLNCSFLVNSAWSILVFKEIRGKRNLKLFGGAFLLNVISSLLISISKG